MIPEHKLILVVERLGPGYATSMTGGGITHHAEGDSFVNKLADGELLMLILDKSAEMHYSGRVLSVLTEEGARALLNKRKARWLHAAVEAFIKLPI